MNKKIKLFIITALLLLFIQISYTYASQKNTIFISVFPGQDSLDISAQLSFPNTQHEISAYYNDANDYYLFLPSYAIGKKISYVLADNIKITTIENEKKLLEKNTSFLVNDSYTVHILAGSDIPTVFLDLKHDLSYVTSDKTLSDSGQATFLAADGSVVYNGKLEEIHGRGNVTWDYLPKKPFNITLNDSISLYGISASDEYSLITSYDCSFIRNQLSNEMADLMNLAYMQRRNINLYINGDYQGIFELCERISADSLEIVDLETSNKESIKASQTLIQETSNESLPDWNNTPIGKWWHWDNDHTVNTIGGYILETDMPTRYAVEASGFTLDTGAYMVCKEPSYLSQAQYEYISSYTRQCEVALYQALADGSSDILAKYIDMPSFIAKYLVEEVSKNIDCSITSQYFYMNNDGLLAAGPVWDHDHAYGAFFNRDGIDFHSPEGFSARNVPGTFVWWEILYYQKDFYQDMITTYNDTLYPFLHELTDTRIVELENELTDSAVMDFLRWQRSPTEEEARKGYHNYVTDIIEFLDQRSEFLYHEWNS